MNKKMIDELADEIIVKAVKSLMDGTDAFTAMLVLFVKEGRHQMVVSPLRIEKDSDKVFIAEELVPAVLRKNPIAIFIVIDGWIKDPKTMERTGELIGVAYMSQYGLSLKMSKYHRLPDKIVCDAIESYDDAVSPTFFSNVKPEMFWSER